MNTTVKEKIRQARERREKAKQDFNKLNSTEAHHRAYTLARRLARKYDVPAAIFTVTHNLPMQENLSKDCLMVPLVVMISKEDIVNFSEHDEG